MRRTAIKPRKPYKPVAVRRYHDWVASLPCLVSGRLGVTLHHVTGYADKPGRFARDEWLVVPLAPEFHLIQHGSRTSVEALGHQGFFEAYGIDLYAEAMKLADHYKLREAA